MAADPLAELMAENAKLHDAFVAENLALDSAQRGRRVGSWIGEQAEKLRGLLDVERRKSNAGSAEPGSPAG